LYLAKQLWLRLFQHILKIGEKPELPDIVGGEPEDWTRAIPTHALVELAENARNFLNEAYVEARSVAVTDPKATFQGVSNPAGTPTFAPPQSFVVLARPRRAAHAVGLILVNGFGQHRP
jgi:hypothetical protein